MTDTRVRHILGLSGGKDSTALAIYLRDRIPEMEYFFCDTDKELPETYAYLNRLEAYLGKPIAWLSNGGRGFDHHLILRRGFLPSPQVRWCTEELKIKPIERFVGDARVISYVAIRADEDRRGYVSTKPNIVSAFPFIEDGIALRDVIRILESSGVGLPDYYRWRSRSGCFFCFFQAKIDWVGLLEHHPHLFEEACRYEKPEHGEGYTWCDGESLHELARPERVAQIKAEHAERHKAGAEFRTSGTLWDIVDGSISPNVMREVMETWE